MKSKLWWTGISLSAVLAAVTLLHAEERPRDLRIDLFDKNSDRAGYAIVNPQTGRVDMFDRRSNRTGSGQITPAPSSSGRGSTPPASGTTTAPTWRR